MPGEARTGPALNPLKGSSVLSSSPVIPVYARHAPLLSACNSIILTRSVPVKMTRSEKIPSNRWFPPAARTGPRTTRKVLPVASVRDWVRLFLLLLRESINEIDCHQRGAAVREFRSLPALVNRDMLPRNVKIRYEATVGE